MAPRSVLERIALVDLHEQPSALQTAARASLWHT
jgi:hypothetical protein